MKKVRIKKKVIIVIILVALVLIATGAFLTYNKIMNDRKIEKQRLEQKRKDELLETIKSHYDGFVITNKETNLYELNENNYTVIGTLSDKYIIPLDEIEINYDTKYFKVKDQNYYVSYEDVEKGSEYPKSDRYKKYVVFNENVVTKDTTTFYREDGSNITLNKSFDLPIYIKDTDKYYVEYQKELFYVKKDSVLKTKKSNNTSEKTRDKIRVLTYHTIYDKTKENCTNSSICHSIEQFDSHMKYLSENNYLTLTMKELEMFLDKKIQIPKKTIVVTLDDGKYAKNAVNIVEKYKVYATYFIITSRYSVSGIETTYMNFQAHTHNLHNNYKCSGGNQGGQLLCETEENILKDLATNKEILGKDVFAFAYPFFDYNDRAIKLLKKSGFRMAFVGQFDTDGYSTYNTDRFKLRRKTIFASDSLETFISRLK